MQKSVTLDGHIPSPGKMENLLGRDLCMRNNLPGTGPLGRHERDNGASFLRVRKRAIRTLTGKCGQIFQFGGATLVRRERINERGKGDGASKVKVKKRRIRSLFVQKKNGQTGRKEKDPA